MSYNIRAAYELDLSEKLRKTKKGLFLGDFDSIERESILHKDDIIVYSKRSNRT